jgi:hypothetical protein
MAVMRRESRWPFPALTEWLEAPMPGWARFGPLMRIEDFVVDQLTFAVGDTHRPAVPDLANY